MAEERLGDRNARRWNNWYLRGLPPAPDGATWSDGRPLGEAPKRMSNKQVWVMVIAIMVSWRFLRPLLMDWLDMSSSQVSFLVVAIALGLLLFIILWERHKRRRQYLAQLAEHRSRQGEGD